MSRKATAIVGIRVYSARQAREDARSVHKYWDRVASQVDASEQLTRDENIVFHAQHRDWIAWYNENIVNATFIDGDVAERELKNWRGVAETWANRASGVGSPAPNRPPIAIDPGPGPFPNGFPGLKWPAFPDLSPVLLLLAFALFTNRRD